MVDELLGLVRNIEQISYPECTRFDCANLTVVRRAGRSPTLCKYTMYDVHKMGWAEVANNKCPGYKKKV